MAKSPDLAQPVGDVENSRSRCRKAFDDVEQPFRLGQRGRWLVEHKQARLMADGADNFDPLLLRQRQPIHDRARRNIGGVEAGQQFGRPILIARARGQPERPLDHVGEHQIGGDAQVRQQAEFLERCGNARNPRIHEGTRPIGDAAQGHRAVARLHDPA